jgi:hypothetical protein
MASSPASVPFVNPEELDDEHATNAMPTPATPARPRPNDKPTS